MPEAGQTVLGGILVCAAGAYGALVKVAKNRMPAPPSPEQLILPAVDGKSASFGIDGLPDEATICSCNNVTKGQIRLAICEQELTEVGAVKSCTKAGTGCGGCATLVGDILRLELAKTGVQLSTGLC